MMALNPKPLFLLYYIGFDYINFEKMFVFGAILELCVIL
jgi:hypothetical protein